MLDTAKVPGKPAAASVLLHVAVALMLASALSLLLAAGGMAAAPSAAYGACSCPQCGCGDGCRECAEPGEPNCECTCGGCGQGLGEPGGGSGGGGLPPAQTPAAIYVNRWNLAGEYVSQIESAFSSGYHISTLDADTLVYRYYGGSSGLYSHWVSTDVYIPGSSEVVQMPALPPGNTAEYRAAFVIPSGTEVVAGTAAPQSWNGGVTGGGSQFFVSALDLAWRAPAYD